MSSCYRTSNNKFASAPARMSDGRHFTDYRPNCFTNTRLQVENRVPNSYEYRMFLTRNAEDIMELNRKESFLQNGSTECKSPYNPGTMVPEADKVVCNSQTCQVVHNYEGGVGTGRDYGDSIECLASLSAPPMELKPNQCKPPSYLDEHTDKVYDEQVDNTNNYSGAQERLGNNTYQPVDYSNDLSLIEQEEEQES